MNKLTRTVTVRGQFLGRFSAHDDTDDFIRRLVLRALSDGEATERDQLGCPVTAVADPVYINGESVPVPPGAIAYKYADPTQDARWVFDEQDARDIARKDSNLLIRFE